MTVPGAGWIRCWAHHGLRDVAGGQRRVAFVADRASRDPAPEIASKVAAACRDRGLLIQVVAGNVWRIAAPLTVSDDEIGLAASIIHDSLTECDEA